MTTGDGVRAEALRETLVDRLHREGELRTPALTRAFLRVPRERFAPGAPLDLVYDAHDVVVTRQDARGAVTSSVSAPIIQAVMLDQARIEPGMRVLEIGSGGYDAALIAELVGPTGQVTTVDIDPWVTSRAARFLAGTGYHRVRVATADAEGGLPERAPYDRIVVTAGAWDVPPAWTDQLAPAGVLVVPLRLRRQTRSVAFVRSPGDPEVLLGRDYVLCAFVPVLGAGAHTDQDVDLGPATLQVDDSPAVTAAEAAALRRALAAPGMVRGSGVRLGATESLDDVDLYLTTVADRIGRLFARPGTAAPGALAPERFGSETVFTADSLAYRTSRPSDVPDAYELVVCGHGPTAAALVDAYVADIGAWDRHHRGAPSPRRHGAGTSARIDLYPAGAEIPTPAGPHRIIEKRHRRLLLSWPTPG